MKPTTEGTKFVIVGRLMFLARMGTTMRTMGLPRYVAIHGRGGYHRVLWRFFWEQPNSRPAP